MATWVDVGTKFRVVVDANGLITSYMQLLYGEWTEGIIKSVADGVDIGRYVSQTDSETAIEAIIDA